MNIVADENIDMQIVERHRADGHNVQSVAEFEPGIDDEAVLRESRETNAILLTADKDFGELVFRQGLLHSGVMLIRLAGVALETKAGARLGTILLSDEAVSYWLINSHFLHLPCLNKMAEIAVDGIHQLHIGASGPFSQSRRQKSNQI